MTIWLALLIGFILERIQVIICGNNYDTMFNGYGAIDTTNNRSTLAPMQYRVLVPWMVALYEKLGGKRRIVFYEIIKVIFTAAAIYSVSLAWNRDVAILTAVMLTMCFRYEYWDWGPELVGFALTMTGHVEYAIVGILFHGLSRETVLILPVLYWLRTGDLFQSIMLGILTGCVYAIPRIWGGPKKLYCDRFYPKRNLELLKEILIWEPWFLGWTVFSIVCAALALIAVFTTYPTGWQVVLIMIITSTAMGMIDETRIYGAIFPWIAAFLLR